jgi:RNA polymerase sigma-70 factor (ECF subfamily)
MWLYRIAVNSAKNVLIARVREPVIISLDQEESENDYRSPGLTDLETPEDAAVTDDIREAVGAALAGLPETHCMAITLREIDGLTYKQIAVAMATPIGTVRSRVFRARETIDQRLRRVCAGGLGRRDRHR